MLFRGVRALLLLGVRALLLLGVRASERLWRSRLMPFGHLTLLYVCIYACHRCMGGLVLHGLRMNRTRRVIDPLHLSLHRILLFVFHDLCIYLPRSLRHSFYLHHLSLTTIPLLHRNIHTYPHYTTSLHPTHPHPLHTLMTHTLSIMTHTSHLHLYLLCKKLKYIFNIK